MLIDTHCHLIDRYIPAAELSDILDRAKAAGVGAMVVAGADPGDAPDIIKLIEQYDNLYGTLGIHPQYALAISTINCSPPGGSQSGVATMVGGPDILSPHRPPTLCSGAATPPKGGVISPEINYEHLLSHPKIIAVGEIGLDYHYSKDDRDAQLKLFRAQMDVAARAGLPVCVHSREAAADTIAVLRDYPDTTGVMHFYTGSFETAEQLLSMGYYFSAAGVMTFKNAESIRDVFRHLPIDRIVIETDAPYSAPVPYRGKPCEPAMVAEVAKMLAEIRGLDFSELESILLENTKKLFPKICHDKL